MKLSTNREFFSMLSLVGDVRGLIHNLIIIYWPAKERLQSNLFVFIKLNDIFFLHIVNIMYVVLEWICQI